MHAPVVKGEPRRCAQTTLILRVSRDGAGRVSGVVERVRTGEKARFRGLRAIGGLIARMCRTEEGGAAKPRCHGTFHASDDESVTVAVRSSRARGA